MSCPALATAGIRLPACKRVATRPSLADGSYNPPLSSFGRSPALPRRSARSMQPVQCGIAICVPLTRALLHAKETAAGGGGFMGVLIAIQNAAIGQVLLSCSIGVPTSSQTARSALASALPAAIGKPGCQQWCCTGPMPLAGCPVSSWRRRLPCSWKDGATCCWLALQRQVLLFASSNATRIEQRW